MTCDDANLSAYLDGELAETEKRAVEAHLAACPTCAAELKRFERVRTMMLTQVIPQGLHVPVMETIRKEQFLRLHAQKRLWWVAAAVVLLAIAATAAYRMLGPRTPEPANLEVPVVIANGGTDQPAPGAAREPEAPRTETPAVQFAETDLPLTLSGTVTGTDPKATIASRPSGGQKLYRPGDTVLPGVVLKEIRQGQVILDRGGVMQTLTKGFSQAPQRPKLDGTWQVAYLVNDKFVDYGPTLHMAETGGAVKITGDSADFTLTGRLSGRHFTVDGTPESLPADLQGDFNETFTNVVLRSESLSGFPQNNQITTDKDRYQIKLTKLGEHEKPHDERATYLARERELKAMYEPLRRYAEAHGGRFPSALAQLVPDYVANLDLYAERPDRKLTYYPDATLLDTASLPKTPNCAKGGDVPGLLLAHEAELQRIWGGVAPFVSTLIRVTYGNPDYVYTVNTQGAVSGRSANLPAGAAPALQSQVASDQNNLKQLGLVMKMWQNENGDYIFPGWCTVYPEYLTDPNVLTSPWDQPGTVSYILLYPAASVDDLHALGIQILASQNPVDPNHPALIAQAESVVPIMCDGRDIPPAGDHPATRNVLFMDGHVERLTLDDFARRVKPYMP